MERFYLDTNIIFSYFLKKFFEKKGKQIETKVVNFLIKSSKNIKYAVSILTKTEIIRILRSEFSFEKEDIEKAWKDFVSEISPEYIPTFQTVEEIYNEIVAIVSTTPIKKRVTNLEHLIIAKKNNLIFVTGDKEIISKCGRFYDKVWSYNRLRKFYAIRNNLNPKGNDNYDQR